MVANVRKRLQMVTSGHKCSKFSKFPNVLSIPNVPSLPYVSNAPNVLNVSNVPKVLDVPNVSNVQMVHMWQKSMSKRYCYLGGRQAPVP